MFHSLVVYFFWGWHVVPILTQVVHLWYVCLLAAGCVVKKTCKVRCFRIGYKKAKSQAGATLLRSSILGRDRRRASEIDGAPWGTGKWPCMVNFEEFWKKHTHSLKASPVCKGFRNAGWKWVKSTDGNVMHNLCMDNDCNPQIQHGTEGDGFQEESPLSGSHARVWCSLAGL